jgi:opacity protein-like surface antigen
MNNLVKTSLALVAAGLLSTSALASSGAQDTGFLKGDKEVAPVAADEAMVKDKYFALEAAYQFNDYKPTFNGQSRTYDSFKDSASIGLGVGKMLNKKFSVDGMVYYVPETDFDFDSGSSKMRSSVTTTKLMLNGTFHLGTSMEKVMPYVTAGLGTAYNQYSADKTVDAVTTNYSKDEWKFAYQLGAGVGYKLDNDLKVNLGYRFADNGKAYEVSGVTQERLQSHSVVLGLSVPF